MSGAALKTPLPETLGLFQNSQPSASRVLHDEDTTLSAIMLSTEPTSKNDQGAVVAGRHVVVARLGSSASQPGAAPTQLLEVKDMEAAVSFPRP